MNTLTWMCAQRFANHTWRARLREGCSNGGEVTEVTTARGENVPGP